jgi:hypothetical protein
MPAIERSRYRILNSEFSAPTNAAKRHLVPIGLWCCRKPAPEEHGLCPNDADQRRIYRSGPQTNSGRQHLVSFGVRCCQTVPWRNDVCAHATPIDAGPADLGHKITPHGVIWCRSESGPFRSPSNPQRVALLPLEQFKRDPGKAPIGALISRNVAMPPIYSSRQWEG